MGRIYRAPAAIGDPPPFDPKVPYAVHEQQEREWVKRIAEWAKQNGSGPEAGAEIALPYADGHARYIVLSLRPSVKLIHLAVGDAWDYPYIERLTAADIRRQLERRAAFAKLFGGQA